MSFSEVDEKIASLVEVTDALLRGDFDKKPDVVLDAEGVLSSLAQKINKMVVNMKTVEAPLSSAGKSAPAVVSSAYNVIELMSRSTSDVLNRSDKLADMAERLEDVLEKNNSGKEAGVPQALHILPRIKSEIYDIIASQSYQDVARQKMEVLISELNQMRDWLVEALLVLNISKESAPEKLLLKKELLKEAKGAAVDGPLSQDLVDDLLAEFGF